MSWLYTDIATKQASHSYTMQLTTLRSPSSPKPFTSTHTPCSLCSPLCVFISLLTVKSLVNVLARSKGRCFNILSISSSISKGVCEE
ncbi:Protein of unknown function [Pyronema omphalodes CBS 100304]|uniref:Uncharacterized protein n=1 Tax=Pyronema omphalodes (strain CBS 100304) TaxID=1076935 RepID=U4LDY6_PYROM|nr:Protein of unknown function [Pyronema omphalodes CBS 100304]